MNNLLVYHMFDERYPTLSAWILFGDGWIELGQNDLSRSTVGCVPACWWRATHAGANLAKFRGRTLYCAAA